MSISDLMASLGGLSVTPAPLPSTPISGPALPFGQASAPQAPMPLPAPSGQHGGIDWMSAIGPLATIALAATGHPNAAIGAAHGTMQAHEQMRQEKERQAELQMQQQRVQATMQAQALAEEQRRQKGIQDLIMQTTAQVKGAKTKNEYDTIVNTAEAMGGQFYGLRPNAIRALAPYRAPDAGKIMYGALDALFKNPANKSAVEDGSILQGSINVDTDGDGKPDKPVPIAQAIQESGYPVQIDPTTQKPLILPKGSGKTANVQDFDLVYGGLVSAFQTDKGRAPNDAERGDLALKARRQVKDASATPPVNINLTSGPQADQLDTAAKAVLDGRMAPSQAATMFGGMGKEAGAFKRALTTRIMQLNPEFNFQSAEANFQFGKNTGTQNTVRYMESVQESMPMLLDRATKLGNGQFRSLNALINQGKSQVNNVDLKRFQTDVTLVADEVAKILQGGGTGSGTSDAKLRQASNILNTSDSPQAIAGALQDINTLIGFRKGSLTKGTFLDKGSKPAGSGKISVKGPDGNTYSFASQQQADAFLNAAKAK